MCELLSPEEIEDALGQPVASEITATIDCRYTTIDANLPRPTEVTVSVIRPALVAAESFEQAIAAGVEPGDTAERINGLGDIAMLVTTADLSVMNVKAGNAWLTLGMPRLAGSSRPRQTLSHLAHLALQRLG